MGLLDGRVGIIYGVRNERSLGWGCAASIAREGGKFLLGVLTEREQKDAEKLVATVPNAADTVVQICNLTVPEDVEAIHQTVAEKFGRLDFMIHAVAFAKKDELSGRYVDTSSEGFQIALTASTYTFTAATKAAERFMQNGGSVLTLSYLGAERAIPGYNVMGVAKAALESSVRYLAADLGPQQIRVNAISAGPAMTLAARGISGFTDLYREAGTRAPLRRNTIPDEVGDVAAFLISDWARGITGDVIFVDNGLHILAG